MHKDSENVAQLFTWIEKEDEGLKDENCSYQYCMYWIFPLYVNFFRSKFWIIIIYLHKLR